MYTGLLAYTVAGAQLNSYWFVYFILPIPAILTSWLAYYLGLRDIKVTAFFRQSSPATKISTENPHPHMDDYQTSNEGKRK